MKDLGRWIYTAENKDIDYTLVMYNAVKKHFEGILTPRIVDVVPKIHDKKVRSWAELDKLIEKQMPVHEICLAEVTLKMPLTKAELENPNLFFISILYSPPLGPLL